MFEITETFAGSRKTDNLPKLRVFKRNGKIYSLTNKLLWLLKELGIDKEILVDLVKDDPLFTITNKNGIIVYLSNTNNLLLYHILLYLINVCRWDYNSSD